MEQNGSVSGYILNPCQLIQHRFREDLPDGTPKLQPTASRTRGREADPAWPTVTSLPERSARARPGER